MKLRNQSNLELISKILYTMIILGLLPYMAKHSRGKTTYYIFYNFLLNRECFMSNAGFTTKEAGIYHKSFPVNSESLPLKCFALYGIVLQ